MPQSWNKVMNMTTHRVSIANDFSRVPAGRYVTDGEMSGENFRKKILEPYLAEGGEVVIDLDATEGYGSSFLEEAFGGLVRAGHEAATLKRKLQFVSQEDPSLVDEILSYIDDAQRRRNH